MGLPQQDTSKFDVLVIDSDISARMRLKQAAVSVHHFGAVEFSNNPDEAVRRIEGGGRRLDVVFISYRFDQAQAATFIRKAKETQTTQDAAFVLVLKPSDQDSSKVAANVMVGADGFLMEPFSVDGLVEITRLAARIRKERSEAREKAAINFIVKDIMEHLDRVAYIKSCKIDLGRSLRKLRDACAVFRTFSDDSVKTYLDVAQDLFEHAPIPDYVNSFKAYKGASDRLKKKMIERIQAEEEGE